MPIYEYGCDNCGNKFEELIFTDEIPACPKCGSHDTKKLMSCCARHKNGGQDGYAAPSGGGCAGCSGGNCSACGH